LTPAAAHTSVFDLLSISQVDGEKSSVDGNECALWFCIHGYSISVNGGIQNESLVGSWSTTTVGRSGTGSRGVEHVFVNIPANQLNVDNRTRYAVTHEALTALRSFMADTTVGSVYADVGNIDYSSD
jgi:hypothetical protein